VGTFCTVFIRVFIFCAIRNNTSGTLVTINLEELGFITLSTATGIIIVIILSVRNSVGSFESFASQVTKFTYFIVENTLFRSSNSFFFPIGIGLKTFFAIVYF